MGLEVKGLWTDPADRGNHRVRKITPDCTHREHTHEGNIIITDYWNNRVHKITTDGTVSTCFVGSCCFAVVGSEVVVVAGINHLCLLSGKIIILDPLTERRHLVYLGAPPHRDAQEFRAICGL